MRSITLLTTAVLCCATTAFAQDKPPSYYWQTKPEAVVNKASTPMLEIAARGYAADGQPRSMAGDSTSEKLDGYVWADRSLCTMGSGHAVPATTPWVGWHYTASLQNVTPAGAAGSMTFRVEWQRMWSNGVRVTDGSKGVSMDTLRDGQRIELDRVTGGGTEGCGTTQVRLEVGSSTQTMFGMAWRPGFNKPGAVGAGGAGAGGRGAFGSLPAQTAAGGNAFANYKDAQVRELIDNVVRAKRPEQYDAELWLVHRHPDGKETSELRQNVRFTGTDLGFTFPAVVVSTPKGDITLDFTGTLRTGVGPDVTGNGWYFFNSKETLSARLSQFDADYRAVPAPKTGASAATTDTQQRIAVTIVRRARATFTPPLDTRGGSYFFMNVPDPTQVIEFEFPSLPQPTEDLLKGHTFSLRLRVKPVGK